MPFNFLVLSSLIHKCSHSEDACKVSLKRNSDETALFFVIDERSGISNDARRYLSMPNNSKMCDVAVYFANVEKKIFCLVELKGRDVDTAITQIIETKKKFQSKMRRSLQGVVDISDIRWTAYIVVHHSSPIRCDISKLTAEFGQGYFKITHDPDIGKFLRNVK